MLNTKLDNSWTQDHLSWDGWWHVVHFIFIWWESSRWFDSVQTHQGSWLDSCTSSFWWMCGLSSQNQPQVGAALGIRYFSWSTTSHYWEDHWNPQRSCCCTISETQTGWSTVEFAATLINYWYTMGPQSSKAERAKRGTGTSRASVHWARTARGRSQTSWNQWIETSFQTCLSSTRWFW